MSTSPTTSGPQPRPRTLRGALVRQDELRYIVSVATTEGAGRSATCQLLHASEVAFSADLPTQLAALMQTSPDFDNTEMILETTANSFNHFYKLWRKSEAGESEFIPVFLPS